ncbi:MAG: Rieske (2Fe-2S) protein [Pseudomonadota bacterium]
MTTVPVGLTRDLPPKRVMRAHVAGRDLVVWRATNGEIAAWGNRCPHRGMALSHGFVRGNSLACLYHGWHYGGSGACSYIPAHPDLTPPETIKAEVFSVCESDGVIWVNTQGDAAPAPVTIPAQPLRSFFVDAAPEQIADCCTAVDFDGTAPSALGDAVYKLGARRVILLHNTLGAARTQITALIDADATPDACSAVSRWCEAVRLRASTRKVAA